MVNVELEILLGSPAYNSLSTDTLCTQGSACVLVSQSDIAFWYKVNSADSTGQSVQDCHASPSVDSFS